MAIDALDGQGVSEFLHDLFNLINKHRLPGLKFFITSRSDPDLVTRVEDFEGRLFYRLEEVPDMDELMTLAAGLFVYATTVVKYMGGHTRQEQKPLKKLLPSTSKSTTSQTPPVATDLLDELYIQILLHIFHRFTEDILYTDAVSFTPSSVPQSVAQCSLLSCKGTVGSEAGDLSEPAVRRKSHWL